MNQEANNSADPVREGVEEELCSQCLEGNPPGSTFCRKCGSPLSSYAAIGPFESVFAEGHVYRRAVEQPQRLVVVVGIWLIFGVGALLCGLLAFWGFESGSLVDGIMALMMGSVFVFLVAKSTANYRKRRRLGEEEPG